MAELVIAALDPVEGFEKSLPIQVASKNLFPVIPPTSDEINSTGKFYA